MDEDLLTKLVDDQTFKLEWLKILCLNCLLNKINIQGIFQENAIMQNAKQNMSPVIL